MRRGGWPPARRAIAALFLMNGFVMGSWAPKIPVFAGRLGLDESALGLMILVVGIGSLVAMPLTGAVIARAGSRAAVLPLATGVAVALLLVTAAPSVALAAMAVFFTGAVAGGMDVAMNANAVSVEKGMGRAIMSSCHGFWSLGALAGAAGGGYLIAVLGAWGHGLAVTAVELVLLAAAWRHVLSDSKSDDTGAHHAPLRLPASPLPWLVGVMALFSMIPEGAVLDWGALYLRQELGATLTQSGLAFGAFSATMAAMRFAGDGVRDRFGAVATLRFSSGIALAGMLLAGFAPSAWLAVAGFALAGLGISNMVPIAFSAAGNLPGMAPGVALSAVTFMGYSGILVAPAAIGFIAEHTGFAAVFATLPLLFLVVLAFSGLARHADHIPVESGRAVNASAMKS